MNATAAYHQSATTATGTGTAKATIAGVCTALFIVLVLPRFTAHVAALHDAMALLLGGFAIASPALWIANGRKTPLNAFGLGASVVVAGAIVVGFLLLGFLMLLFAR